MYTKRILQLGVAVASVLFIGCSSGGSTGPGNGVGGKQSVGGASSSSTTGNGTTGGATNQATNTGGANTSAGGNAQTGGASGNATGGVAPTGGKSSTSATGGTKATGGSGTKATGGAGTTTGGKVSIDTSAGGSVGVGGAATGGASSTEPQCVGDPTQLINPDGWNCDLTADIQLQGAVYPYGDGTSCPYGDGLATANICSDKGCCLSGTTTPATADTDYKNWGCGIGMELNSSGGDNAVKSQYAGPIQCFDITITGSSGKNEVRIGFTQADNTANQVSPFVSVAAFTNGYTGRVCFKDAECPDWAVTAGTCSKAVGTTGTPFDLQIQVSAGGTTAAVGAYDLCVTSIVPVIDPGNTGTTNSCTSATGTGTITDKGGSAHVTCSGKDYIVQNNVWGSGSASQTITYGPGTKFKITNQTGSNSGDAPVSYPSLFIGANNGRSTSGSGLPLAVSSITATSLKTAWTWTKASSTSGSYNAAYDVWFSTGSGGDPSTSVPSGGYLMVWFHKPTVDQPIGSSVASTTLAGKNWNVWYGTNSGSGKPCVSYVAQTDVMSLDYKLGEFIRDAVTRGYVQNSWYLTNVYAGFEVWSGGVGLETTDFAVTVP